MAGPAYATQARWRNELIVAGTSLGYWDRAEMDFTSENQTITDPEDGQVNIGGRQTAGDVEFTRPWKSTGRDRQAFLTALKGRGRVSAAIIVHELDVYGNPMTTAPLDTFTGVVTQTNLPESSAGGDDASQASITVTVNP